MNRFEKEFEEMTVPEFKSFLQAYRKKITFQLEMTELEKYYYNVTEWIVFKERKGYKG